MTISSKRTTKTNVTISWRKSLKNEAGVTFATMSASIDERRPLGTVTFSVINQSLFEENLVEARNAYEVFQKEVVDYSKSVVTNSEVVEEI